MNITSKHLMQIEEAMDLLDTNEVNMAISALKLIRARGGSVYLVGNGGSAATCSHFANDLTKMGKMVAYSVPDMTPLTLAHGNDNGWSVMFSNVLRRMMKPEDVLIAITCSGESVNVVHALEIRNTRILLTGPEDSSAVFTQPDIIIRAMAQEITVMEDIHSIICHAIARGLMDG